MTFTLVLAIIVLILAVGMETYEGIRQIRARSKYIPCDVCRSTGQIPLGPWEVTQTYEEEETKKRYPAHYGRKPLKGYPLIYRFLDNGSVWWFCALDRSRHETPEAAMRATDEFIRKGGIIPSNYRRDK